MRALLVACLFLFVFEGSRAEYQAESPSPFNHLLERMKERHHRLREMDPLDHFSHVLGDVHVLMKAGRTYRSKLADLDLFGSPRYHSSTMRPRYHIFNSDWDDSVQDVFITGRNVVIRTSRPQAMMRMKVGKGMIFSTAMDFTQEGDDEHRGSLDFLLTQDPVLIDENLILLENVIEMEFADLWETASVKTDVQHYQYTQRDGTFTSRAAPANFTVFRPDEEFEFHPVHKRGLGFGDFLGDLWGGVKNTAVQVAKTVVAVGETALSAVDVVFDVATIIIRAPILQAQLALGLLGSETGSDFSFNYNKATGKAIIAIPLYPARAEDFGLKDIPSPKPPPPKEPSAGIVKTKTDFEITFKLACKDCWGKASFQIGRASCRERVLMPV